MEVSGPELSEILGVPMASVFTLSNKGIIPKPKSRGKYDLIKCAKSYIEHLKEQTAVSNEDEAHYKALNQKLESELRQIKISTLKGDLIDSSLVWKAWERLGVAFRARILQIPNAYADRLSLSDDSVYIKEQLEKAVRDALEEISELKIDVEATSEKQEN